MTTYIEGTIEDVDTGDGVPSASVIFSSAAGKTTGETGTTTNAEGNFQLEGDTSNDYILVSSVGYKPVLVPLTFFETNKNVHLEKSYTVLPGVVVTPAASHKTETLLYVALGLGILALIATSTKYVK